MKDVIIGLALLGVVAVVYGIAWLTKEFKSLGGSGYTHMSDRSYIPDDRNEND